MSIYQEGHSHEHIVKTYFSNSEKRISLKPGEVLLEQYELNDRLFYVAQGKVCGYLPDKELEEPVFEADEDSFVGVYSYFSNDRKSYSQVVAEENAVVFYYNDNPFELPQQEAREFLTFLFGVVVRELRDRQHFAGEMAHDREKSLQKLIQVEKMVTLGQMAAGIAHELNNAIGSLNSNLNQVEERIIENLEKAEDQNLIAYFNKGLNEGQPITSSEARAARAELEKLKFLDKPTVKILARAGVSPSEIKRTSQGSRERAQRIASFWELGYSLHDMHIATTHSSHVIKSVKSVGVANQNWTTDTDINKTVQEALAILRSITKNVGVEEQFDPDLPLTEACSGELIQVWINLIKNAVESLINSGTDAPKVQVATSHNEKSILVTITDNGPGIPPELSEKIFQPNFTTKVGGLSFGLGLGLTISKRIISEHNGKIELESEAGHTHFKIYIPIINK
ncbi:MAG: ATP-binding protein [Bacteroidota bacterium]